MEPAETPQIYETGGFRIDAAQRVLLAADGSRVPLSSRAFELLLFFLRHPGELLDKNRLMAAVWPNTVVEENNLTQSIGALRKALGEAPGEHRFLVTEPGRGYRFVSPVRATSEAPAEKPVPRRRDPRLLLLALGVLGLVGAAILALNWRRPAPAAVERSIAVLPFENRSEARENAFLAQGIQDEILTLLTRIGELRVIPRNSTERYASGAHPAPMVGRELGVAYLLNGSVQRAGDRVRVNVSLIDAGLDRQIWSSSYERSAGEIFAVESEVARDVAAALQARLTAQERASLEQPPTRVPAAYESYLRAKAFAERVTRTEAEIHGAIAAYAEAARLDPEFATAWAQLSRRHANLYSLSYDRSSDRRDEARSALERAVALRPELPEVQVARGYLLHVVEADLEGAQRIFLDLEARQPSNPDVTGGLAAILRELGHQERSDDYARRTLALDPQNPYRHGIICQSYAAARQLDLAEKTCERALQLLPGDTGLLVLEATVFQARGELDRARALLQSLKPGPGDWRTLRAMSRQHLLDRKPREAVELLDAYLPDRHEPDRHGQGAWLIMVRRWLGDAQRLAGDRAASRATYKTALDELGNQVRRQEENPLLVAEYATLLGRLADNDVSARVALEQVEMCSTLAARTWRDSLVAECEHARIQVLLATGKPGDVVERLKSALTIRGGFPPLTPGLLRLDPDFDGLRDHAGFQALLRPQAAAAWQNRRPNNGG